VNATVCVTGGSGGIGRALLEQLQGLYAVKALFRTRSPASDEWERRGCAVVWGDLANDAALARLVEGTRIVFHCAALVAQASYDEAYAVNVEGTRRLARLAAAHGCERFVHVSSVAVYGGAADGAAYVEDTPLCEREGMAVYSLTKLQAERALEEVARETGLEYVILRPTSVYGPHTRPHTLIPVEMIRKGLPLVLGDGQGLLDVVYVDDVARGLLLAARSPAARGGVFNVGHETVTFDDFHAHYSRMLNRPARRLPRPVISGVVRLLQPFAGKPRLRDVRNGARLLLAMAANKRPYPSARARALLGYAPESTLPTGMLKTELWLKQEGLLDGVQPTLEDYGALPFSPRAVIHPATEAEIVQAVQLARQKGLRARAIGSLHSTCPVPYTDGICLVLDRYRKLLSVDGPLVTVQAGMILRDLNETLAQLNLALPINGSITAQTVSGAISTGTHGGSIFQGSLSDSVEAVRIVRADGSALDIDRAHELFPAVVVSFGLLGILSTVTFRCVGAFVLRSRTEVRPAEEVLAEFDHIHRRSVYTCIFYFPVTDQMEIFSADRVDGAAPAALEPGAPAPARSRSPARNRLRQRVSTAALKGLAWVLLRHNSIQRRLTRVSVGSSYQARTARSDRVFAMTDVGTAGRSPTLLQDMEVAVPYDQAPAALGVLRQHFLATQEFPLMPIHVRCTTRSDFWLSPAHGQDVCFLEFWQYPAAEDYFTRIHELLAPFRYRFHWGKATRADRSYIERLYERWHDFARLREEWDPDGIFLNQYLEGFFGPRTGPPR
jgi:L-gulonolactone oxidase